MDVSLLIRHRLKELGLEQKDLAAAARVTESYISQLLGRKKPPPAPGRTDLYEKIGEFLKLPQGELSRLADLERLAELKKKAAEPPEPLFKECRELILRKCDSARRGEVGRIFEKQAFGELERLVIQKLLDATQAVVREELQDKDWIRRMAEVSGCSDARVRAAIPGFLGADAFNVTVENCVWFLDPMIESWDIDLKTFALEIVLSHRLAPERVKRFEFVEKAEAGVAAEPGFEQFLKDRSLSGDITAEEIELLRRLRFSGRRPTALYYYRELQNLRDPLHFPPAQRTRA